MIETEVDGVAQVQESSKYPYVFSISYGGNEANSPVGYRNRVDTEISKVSAPSPQQ